MGQKCNPTVRAYIKLCVVLTVGTIVVACARKYGSHTAQPIVDIYILFDAIMEVIPCQIEVLTVVYESRVVVACSAV